MDSLTDIVKTGTIEPLQKEIVLDAIQQISATDWCDSLKSEIITRILSWPTYDPPHVLK